MQDKNISGGTAAAGRGRCRLEAEYRSIGRDLLVWIWGGAQPHIGSVTITEPVAGKIDPDRYSTTSSVYSFPGHKDEAVARLCGERIAAAFGRRTVICAGIHISGATADEIALVMKHAGTLCGKLIRKLRREQ